MGGGGLALVGELRRADDPFGTLLFLHGGGQTRHSWANTAERLANQRWTTVSMDTRGHGDSAWAQQPLHYSMAHLVADLQAIVAAIGEPPVVIGASMGGMTALVGEGEHPGLLRALVLVDVAPTIELSGALRITEFMRSGIRGFDTLEDVAAAVSAYNPHRVRAINLDGLRKNVRQREDGRWYWHWDPQFMEHDPNEPDRGIGSDRPRKACEGVTVPTLLIRGRQSDIVSEEGAQELLHLIKGSQLVDVAGAGHMVAGDDNDVFTREVEGFLANLV